MYSNKKVVVKYKRGILKHEKCESRNLNTVMGTKRYFTPWNETSLQGMDSFLEINFANFILKEWNSYSSAIFSRFSLKRWRLGDSTSRKGNATF